MKKVKAIKETKNGLDKIRNRVPRSFCRFLGHATESNGNRQKVILIQKSRKYLETIPAY